MEEFGALVTIIDLITSSISFLLSVGTYVLTALGLYTIAQRRGINKPWLAWIPVVNVWTLGCISDQYRYVVKGEKKSKRKVLIGKGTVSHDQAIKKAEQEFEIYRQREMEMLESDFDREIKKLKEKN